MSRIILRTNTVTKYTGHLVYLIHLKNNDSSQLKRKMTTIYKIQSRDSYK